MQGYKGLGFQPEVKPLTFFQDDYGLKLGDGEGDADDEEDDIELSEEDGEEESRASSKAEL